MIIKRMYPSVVRLEECSLADCRMSRTQVWKEGLKRESKMPDAGGGGAGGWVSWYFVNVGWGVSVWVRT